jgi:hypothetical protein
MELTPEQQIAEIWQLFKETDKRFKITDKIVKETTLEIKEIQKDMNRRSKETDEKIKALSNLFTGQWGKLIEALVEPEALQLFKDRGIKIKYALKRIEGQQNAKEMETDLLLIDKTEIVAVEVKTTLKVNDVREFLEDLKYFFDFFSGFRGCKIYGAVAALNIEEEADKFAYRQGLFVLKAGKEGLITMLNDEKFKPKDFSKEHDIKAGE